MHQACIQRNLLCIILTPPSVAWRQPPAACCVNIAHRCRSSKGYQDWGLEMGEGRGAGGGEMGKESIGEARGGWGHC